MEGLPFIKSRRLLFSLFESKPGVFSHLMQFACVGENTIFAL